MLELCGVYAGYAEKTVLRDISLRLPEGRITAVIGANGSGKSTLLKLCAGHITPKKGGALLDGKALCEITPVKLARQIAYVPQSRPIPAMTIETQVLHGRFPWTGFPRVYTAKDREIARLAMEKTGILPKRADMLSRVSGGERQKAYLAMALAQEARHLLFDEPSANLDIAVQLSLHDIFKELRGGGKCVAVVMHDLAAALALADDIAVLKEGRLLQTATPDEVLSSGVIAEAFGVRVTKGAQLRFLPVK
ncbi:MAG: ABC transporter ATP-binding protein [Oscillospiraceae bacterium]|jgi:iron complex transport system ATP-binding protein|nr:ABC transporter ATP-binding protein [Oscillospiraceae bacterium]